MKNIDGYWERRTHPTAVGWQKLERINIYTGHPSENLRPAQGEQKSKGSAG